MEINVDKVSSVYTLKCNTHVCLSYLIHNKSCVRIWRSCGTSLTAVLTCLDVHVLYEGLRKPCGFHGMDSCVHTCEAVCVLSLVRSHCWRFSNFTDVMWNKRHCQWAGPTMAGACSLILCCEVRCQNVKTSSAFVVIWQLSWSWVTVPWQSY